MGKKLKEIENLAVFTTRQWIEFGQPILRVVHDTEGDWQFLTGDQTPEDIRLVAFRQMVSKDKTLKEAIDLECGYSLERKFAGDKWIKEKIQS